MPKKQESFELRYYKQLLGKTIKEVQINEQDGDGEAWPVLVFGDGSFAQVSLDPEGNGPGHLFICDTNGDDMLPSDKK